MRKVIGYLQKQTTFRMCFKATLAAGNMLVIFLVVGKIALQILLFGKISSKFITKQSKKICF